MHKIIYHSKVYVDIKLDAEWKRQTASSLVVAPYVFLGVPETDPIKSVYFKTIVDKANIDSPYIWNICLEVRIVAMHWSTRHNGIKSMSIATFCFLKLPFWEVFRKFFMAINYLHNMGWLDYWLSFL